MSSCEIIGSEALVRWRRSPTEVVAPAEFIALAEETGNIETIGEWVLREAVEQNARWQRLGLPPTRVAVNISAKQLQSAGFPELVVKVLEESRLDSSWLELELTETALMANLDESAVAIEALRNAGIRVSIDDFGTGYSSLSYLRRFSFSCLKMDRSFVAALTEDEKSLAVAQGLIALAHNLRLAVTAEGVETEEQLRILRRYGCDQFQGFLASKPLVAERFKDLLESGPMTSLLHAAQTGEPTLAQS
jgi:EAL domain-containing protein (putative c-di-GMP-specific phosphodiesterase class I)